MENEEVQINVEIGEVKNEIPPILAGLDISDETGTIKVVRGIYIVLPPKSEFENMVITVNSPLVSDYKEVEVEYENEHINMTYQELLDKLGFQQKTGEKNNGNIIKE